MTTASQTLIDLETRFWQSMVDNDSATAADLLAEPALMVSGHGAMQFDRATYRRMADDGATVVQAFKLSQMDVLFANDSTAILTYQVQQRVAPRSSHNAGTEQSMVDSSTWVKAGTAWRCVAHTETPVEPQQQG